MRAAIQRFDERTLGWINSHAGQWDTFDKLVMMLSQATLFKTVPLLAIIVILWFRQERA